MKSKFISFTILVTGLFIFFLVACEKNKSGMQEANSKTLNYVTFSSQRMAVGGDYSQTAEKTFNLHPDVTKIKSIKMYVKLDCPQGGCDPWDVYAHIQVKDPTSGDWYEMGRYITPYGVGNEKTGRGFEIDVTDFKSLLQGGNVTLRAFVEVWGSNGWLLSVDFDFQESKPDYKYYAVAKVLQYNRHSLDGVVYGENASAFNLAKSITIPKNAKVTHLRTIITGWGHATPADGDGRPCAEWCFRTHQIRINGNNTFSHYMGPIGCSSNQVQPQNGNWSPDRAGWCPGMAVPVRINPLVNSMAGQIFTFEYWFESWKNDLQSTADNKHAYYAISTYVVVKSDEPIQKPVVVD